MTSQKNHVSARIFSWADMKRERRGTGSLVPSLGCQHCWEYDEIRDPVPYEGPLSPYSVPHSLRLRSARKQQGPSQLWLTTSTISQKQRICRSFVVVVKLNRNRGCHKEALHLKKKKVLRVDNLQINRGALIRRKLRISNTKFSHLIK